MKTYTTTTEKEFTVDYASALAAGHGHKKITATLVDENGNSKEFTATTSFMAGYNQAKDLEGQEKYEALFELVESNLYDKINEWIQEEKN